MLFSTDFPEHPYGSYGGTLTLVRIENRVFAVGCAHSVGDFSWQGLLLPKRRTAGPCAHLKGIVRISNPIDHAIDSDIMDIVAIEVSEDPDWFEDQPLSLDISQIADCSEKDELVVYGYPAQLTNLVVEPRLIGGIDVKIWAHRRASRDIVLRQASSYASEEFNLTSLSGLSGSPVLRVSDGLLCGTVVRGGVGDDRLISVSFVEASDVFHLLAGTRGDAGFYRYDKQILTSELPFSVPEQS